MARCIRALCALFFIAFAMGMTGHATQAAAMTAQAALADHDASMAGCDGSSRGDGDAGSCRIGCVLQHPALPLEPVVAPAIAVEPTYVTDCLALVGQSGPPDPHPPKFVIPG